MAKTIYTKLANAKAEIANTKMVKQGHNSYSNYDYFTPEQVAKLVYDACVNNDLLTMFSLKRDANGEYGELTIVDLDNDDTLTFIAATAIPQITATNAAQQLGGAMTFAERYLKQTAFWIYNNDLDFDTTENTKKAAEKATEQERFNKEQLDAFTKIASRYKTAEDAIKVIKSKYRISKAMEEKVRELYKSLDTIKS